METVGTQIAELNQTLVDYYTEQLEQLQQQYSVSLNQSNEALTQLNFQYDMLLGNYSSLMEDYSGMVALQQQLTAEVNALMETIEKELNATIPTWQHVTNFTLSMDGTVTSQPFYVNTSNWRIKWTYGDWVTMSTPYGITIQNEEGYTVREFLDFKSGIITSGVCYPYLPQGNYTVTIVNISDDGVNFVVEQFI